MRSLHFVHYVIGQSSDRACIIERAHSLFYQPYLIVQIVLLSFHHPDLSKDLHESFISPSFSSHAIVQHISLYFSYKSSYPSYPSSRPCLSPGSDKWFEPERKLITHLWNRQNEAPHRAHEEILLATVPTEGVVQWFFISLFSPLWDLRKYFQENLIKKLECGKFVMGKRIRNWKSR